MNRLSSEFDATIIGAGVSGLAAAVTLAESGARVIVFEKQPSVGGTSINFRGLRSIKEPPFYAVKAQTVFLGTLGGIKINHKTEVLDTADRVIPGLYACGFDAGGMYGDSYSIRSSTGLSSGFAVNSGRIAGKNALKYFEE